MTDPSLDIDREDEASNHPWPWPRVDGTVISTGRRIRHAFDQALKEYGVTMPEAALLAFVTQSGPLTQSEAARGLDTGRAATGLRVDALETRGLLKRQPDPSDRRVWLIMATPSGRQLVKKINKADAEFRERLRSGISREERDIVASVLIRMQQNIGIFLAER